MRKQKAKNPLVYCIHCGSDMETLLEKEVKLTRKESHAVCTKCEEANDPATKPLLKFQQIKPLQRPDELYNILNKEIIGQEKAKRLLSVAVCNHINRQIDPDIPKSNVLILGPSGTGKTRMCEILAANSDVPFVNYDSTSLTTNGYTGDSIENIFSQLLISTDMDKSRAERAIIFLDEIDKKAFKGQNSGEINTIAVQHGLLKLMEGSTITVEINKSKHTLSTDKMLFICAGAFSSLDYGESTTRSVGLNSKVVTTKKMSIQQSLIKYGMLNEFIGRFSLIAHTHTLSKEQLIQVLKTEGNKRVTGQIKAFASYGVELVFKDDFFELLANIGQNEETGTRSIFSAMDNILSNLIFEIDDDTKLITLEKNGWKKNKSRKTKEYLHD